MKRKVNFLIPVGLFLLGILTRVPFRSRFLYHWDSVNFALGMEHFDVYLHQPHPPGYFLYVMLGRLVYRLVGEANASLVWISVVAAGLAAALMFSLGRSLWNRQMGILAALLLLSSPLFWFHGEVALSYMVEAVFVVLVALLCCRHLTGSDDRIWLSAIVLGLAGGFRQNTMLFLLPLWAVTVYRFRWRKVIVAIGALALTCLAWLLPMMSLTGGVLRYWEALGAAGQNIAEEAPLSDAQQFVVNGVRLAAFTGYALGIGVLPLALSVWCWTRDHLGQWRSWMRWPRLRLFFWWIMPSLLFFAFIHIRQPGHTFTFMPAVLLILSFVLLEGIPQAIRQWRHSERWGYALAGLVILFNMGFFLIAPPFLFGIRRVTSTTPGWPTIRRRDISLDTRIKYIRTHFSPTTTALLSSGVDFRHPDYYLRDYFILRYDSNSALTPVTLPDSIETVIFFGEGLNEGEGARAIELPNGEQLYVLDRHADQEVIVEGTVVSIKGGSP